jgi:predicted nucleotidyltransferase component of viral defense system
VVEIAYPTLLEFSPPVLRAYPKETVVAEKLEAVTALEMLNSRMKDFFDLWALSRMYGFDGLILLKAIKATFDHRGTVIEARPLGLEDEFANDRTKSTQWTAFLRRSRLDSAPARLHETILAVREFAGPPLFAAATGSAFNNTWQAGGPWSI